MSYNGNRLWRPGRCAKYSGRFPETDLQRRLLRFDLITFLLLLSLAELNLPSLGSDVPGTNLSQDGLQIRVFPAPRTSGKLQAQLRVSFLLRVRSEERRVGKGCRCL